MEIVDVRDPELKKKLLDNFPKETNGYVQVGPSKYLFPVKYRSQALEYLDFKLRPDDVWVVTFPRSGTTVMQELLWLLANHLDYKRATEEPMNKRSRFFEASILFSEMEERQMLENAGGDKEKEENVLRICGSRVPLLDADTSPRVIKSHLPLSLLPAKLMNGMLYHTYYKETIFGNFCCQICGSKNNDWQEHFTPEMKTDSENLIAEIYKALPDFKFPSTKCIVNAFNKAGVTDRNAKITDLKINVAYEVLRMKMIKTRYGNKISVTIQEFSGAELMNVIIPKRFNKAYSLTYCKNYSTNPEKMNMIFQGVKNGYQDVKFAVA
ncbi:hypothetical protein B566_EDAN015207 [Ephemera danica]|nr:hypothetical protein B566_EDAN015207 [Ephemera danica]